MKMKIEDRFNSLILSLIKKLWLNILNIKNQSKRENVILCVCIFSVLAFLLYHKQKNVFVYVLLAPAYIYIKSIFQVLASKFKTWKYRDLARILNDKVQVIEVDNCKIKLNSYVTVESIRKKKNELEHFFNRGIGSIEKHKKSFRIVTIKFEDEEDGSAETKKTYHLSDYIKIAQIKKKSVPFLFGVNTKGKIIVEDLKKLKNILISGEIGGGKSTLLHVIIQSLMWYNDLAFFLVDFKRVGLSPYKNFKNCSFVKSLKEFFSLIEKLNTEMENRYDKFEENECDNIDDYNKIAPDKISRIIIVIDEISSIKMSKESGKMEEILTNVAYLGRAAGIHIIAATQRPSAVRLSTEIRDSLISKMSFRVFHPRTQEMTGVLGTENLETGEFMTAHIVGINENDVFKGFYVDRRKSNRTYEELKENKTIKDYINF
ncbi:MAG: FtsK/SpoIIIE domain-containing protein [Clostridiales bacterium]